MRLATTFSVFLVATQVFLVRKPCRTTCSNGTSIRMSRNGRHPFPTSSRRRKRPGSARTIRSGSASILTSTRLKIRRRRPLYRHRPGLPPHLHKMTGILPHRALRLDQARPTWPRPTRWTCIAAAKRSTAPIYVVHALLSCCPAS